MIPIVKHALALATFLKSRAAMVTALTAVLAFTVYQAAERTYVVRVRENREVETYYTMTGDPDEILEQHGYETSFYDEVEFTGFHNKIAEIEITRAFPVEVHCDGNETVMMVTGGTVADTLAAADICLADQDVVDHPLNGTVEEDDIITVTRQKMTIRQEEILLPFESVTVASPAVAPGTRQVVSEGENGLRIDTYALMVVDGVEKEEYLLGEDTVRQPQTHKMVKGFPSYAVSRLDFQVPFDENGEPLRYSRVLRGQRAAGYSAPANAGTASGRPAMAGHVAVNPNVIPYGSKLYIQSPGGGFVYGYAVAADTGSALMQGIIAVDLFYDSYEDSAANGIKTVDIYVLE